jgi:ROS/MUCR transcriptional regulator protein
MKSIQQKRLSRRTRSLNSREGFDFVRCRICGDHRRVLSGRHLSKHGTDREEYMEEYGLSPDELIAKEFRIIRSSRRGYQPHGKRDWIAAIKKRHNQGRSLFARDLRKKYSYLYNQRRG